MASILYHGTVTRDGYHNAFTDLIQWQGQYWIVYRKGQGHLIPTGQITVAVSSDRRRWREVAHLAARGDNRDPRFVLAPDGRLGLFIPVKDPVLEETRQHITFSANGREWEPIRPILSPRLHIFRGRWHEGIYYGLTIYRGPEGKYLNIYTSQDLLDWKLHCRVGTMEQALNESDIWFRPDGEAWMISRTTRKLNNSMFCRARPPYTDWELTDLEMMVHAPALCEHNGMLYVAGRNHPGREGDTSYPYNDDPWPFGRSMAIWKVEAARLEKVLQFPAAGDCSYAGFIKDSEGRLCISYYSQHAYYDGVLPFFKGAIPGTESDDFHKAGYANDIYFAELSLG